jgi:hypothetical protein
MGGGCGLEPMAHFARTVEAHRRSILHWFRAKILSLDCNAHVVDTEKLVWSRDGGGERKNELWV